MTKLTNALLRVLLTIVILFTGLASLTGTSIVYAGDGDPIPVEIISVDPLVNCGDVQFTIQWTGGTISSYLFFMDFGDGDSTEIIPTTESSITISHPYPAQGDYEWMVQVGETDPGIQEDSMTGIFTLEYPEVLEVVLSSSPFPPLFVVGDPGLVEFTATATGGTEPYEYAWDLDVDGLFDTGEIGVIATKAYTDVGKYYPQVMVTDECKFTSSDTMPVVVADPEDACHPTAQKIADGVNTIFPDQADDLYTCEDIYAIFNGDPEGSNTGFGRMWKAYHLAESMEDLTWEDILDWKLNEGGWGALLQLDRFADLLEEHDLPELMGLVMSEEFSLADIRLAVRSTTRYEADFEDALARIAEGANPGELGQFYKLANELEVDPGVDVNLILDAYLAEGLTLAELKHSASFADKMEVDWTEIADARSAADSWGEINQAYKLATDEFNAAQILIFGVQEYKESLRREAKGDQQEEKAQQQEENTQQTAEKLVEQFSAEFGDVMNLLNGECEGEWACVRQSLKEQQRATAEGLSEKDYQNAQQIGSKYGYTQEEVLAYHKDYCGEDWTCTRAHFRNMSLDTKETGKPGK